MRPEGTYRKFKKLLLKNVIVKKIVLCNGDSIGMPRTNVSFFDTWFYKLSISKNDYLFVNNFKRALTSSQLESKDFLENYSPNIVILQVGIVDCAPRFFKSSSIVPKVINRVPKPINNYIWKIVKIFVKRSSEKSDVSIIDFDKNLNSFCKRCLLNKVEKLIIIKIQKPGDNMIKKNDNIITSIIKYNEIIDSLIFKYDFVITTNSLSNAENNDYIEDGYHLNEKGLNKVYQELKNLF